MNIPSSLLSAYTYRDNSNSPSGTVSRKRRSSLSISHSPLISPQASPGTSPSSSFSLTPSKFLKADHESMPLSLEAMCEAVDHLKEKTLKSELTRLGCPVTGTRVERQRRLKTAVKDRRVIRRQSPKRSIYPLTAQSLSAQLMLFRNLSRL